MITPLRITLAAWLTATFSAVAGPLAISDQSFEDNSLSVNGWTLNLEPDWQETGGANSNDSFEEWIPGFAAEGTDHLGTVSGEDVWQDLGVAYAANTRYTLTVAAGHRGGVTESGNETGYALGDANGTVYASGVIDASGIAAGSFADAPDLVFETPDYPAAVGETIRVILQARGSGRSHYDNIRLDATSLAPGGTASVINHPATGVTATSATLSGQVTAIGVGAPAVTIFYGDEAGGSDPGGWDESVSLAGSQAGVFAAGVDGLAPGTTHHFSVRATNAAGDAWATPAANFTTPPMRATIANDPATVVEATTATVGMTVTADGGDPPAVTIYYGPSNGGGVTSAWDESRSLGVVTGSASVNLVSLAPATTYYYRAYGLNAGGGSWALTSGSFTTQVVTPPAVETRPATGITGTNANLRGEVIDAGLEPPVVTIYFGESDGGATENWDASVVAGVKTGEFAQFLGGLAPLTTYFYTVSAANSAGTTWAPTSETFTTTDEIPNDVVINEIHYDPEPKTERVEFVELYNAGATTANLSGWRFSAGVAFTFPSGTELAPGDYLVVSADPADFTAKFGFTPLGPWAGSLENDGETLRLVDAANRLQDRVDYGAGFPWPSGALDSGNSIELIHPSLENDLGGNWRMAGQSPGGSGSVVPMESTWKYFKGTQEPSVVTGEWRQIAFDDSGWLSGQGTVGYGEGFLNTVLPDMPGGYTTIYLRREFTVGNPGAVTSLLLRARYDDGFNAWINGTRVAWDNVSGEDLANTATSEGTSENLSYRETVLPIPQGYLVPGTNVLAVQVLNRYLSGSSDAFWDAELLVSSGASGVSPGLMNGSFSVEVPPAIRQVNHSPAQPGSVDPVVITAKVSDPDGMGAVALRYQVVLPGSYIRLSDSAYGNPASWITVPMLDDGIGDDLYAGDSIYTATIPATVQEHRRLVRYRIEAADGNGNAVEVPYPDDPQANFAYFVYDGNPGWSGKLQPRSGTETQFSPALLDSVPTYHLITRREDHEDSQYIPNSTGSSYRGSDYLWEGTLVYDGEVYDHIRYRARGGVWRYSMGKNMWKFRFHDTHGFEARDNYGKKYPREWRRLNFSAIITQGDFGQRGEQGLYEGIGFRLFDMAGVEAPATHYVHFRIIESAQETGPDQFRGDFQGLYLVIEQPDGRFLETHDLPECNVYKMEGGTGVGGIGGELKYQAGPDLPADSSDLISFKNTYEGATQSNAWWEANLDLDRYYSYRTIVDAIHHYDIAGGKNYYYYHNAETGKWQVHPWDLDLTWDNGAYGNGNEPFKSRVLVKPAFDLENQNRARELLDLLFNEDQTSRMIEEQMSFVYAPGEPSLVQADRYMWDYNPILVSNYVRSSKAGHGKFYQGAVAPGGFEGMAQKMKNYVVTRRAWIENNTLDLPVPDKPILTYVGDPGFSVAGISVETSAFSAAGMSPEAVEWRIGEVYDPVNTPAAYVAGTPYVYEIAPVWETGSAGWAGGADTQAVPVSALVPGRTYRARVRHGATNGRWSSWSEAVEFVAGLADVATYQAGLVVSELMYHPMDATPGEVAAGFADSDFEFIELYNAGPVTLDLTDVQFTDGIEFAFAGAAITSIAPGGRVLVVRNIAAFESRYGSGLPVAGDYGPATGTNFANNGERVELSLGIGSPILAFTYGDMAPWPTEADDGTLGISLVLRDPDLVPNHDDAANWAAGEVAGGAPGAEDLLGFAHWVAGFGLAGQPADDLDGDGVPLMLEYVLAGGSPVVADPRILPGIAVQALDAGNGLEAFVVFEFTMRSGLSDVTASVQTSLNLETWSIPGEMVMHELLDHGDGTETLRYRSASPLGSAPAPLFVRLLVEELSP